MLLFIRNVRSGIGIPSYRRNVRSGIGIQESRNQRYECHLGIPRAFPPTEEKENKEVWKGQKSESLLQKRMEEGRMEEGRREGWKKCKDRGSEFPTTEEVVRYLSISILPTFCTRSSFLVAVNLYI